MVRSKGRSRSAKRRSETTKPRVKTRRVKPPQEAAARRPDIYSWVLVALMLFAGTASATIAYSYGRRALNVVREVPAGNRSVRSRQSPPRPTEAPAPSSPENVGQQTPSDSSPEETPTN